MKEAPDPEATIVRIDDEHRIEMRGHDIRLYTPGTIIWVYLIDTPVAMTLSMHAFDARTLKPLEHQSQIKVCDKPFDWTESR